MNFHLPLRNLATIALLAVVLTAHAADLPGRGVKVHPLKTLTAEETFQTMLVSRAMQKLGFNVQPIQEVDYPAGRIAIANGDATFMANHWDPRKLFEVMELPIADVNAQNQRMNDGQNSQQAIAQHTDAWIRGHQATFDGWIAQALATANK